jgi:hypothetical protein
LYRLRININLDLHALDELGRIVHASRAVEPYIRTAWRATQLTIDSLLW